MVTPTTARPAVPADRWSPAVVFARYHGPDRLPVRGTSIDDLAAAVPFHGIISRGLEGEILDPGEWQRYAHRLFDDQGDDDPAFARLREAASRHRVLSFLQSTRAAERYLETRLAPKGRRLCELWSVKEGHTSSVWRIAAYDDEDGLEEFILNVARDDVAGRELARTAETMRQIHQSHPDLNMAKVEDIAEVEINYYGEPVAVTVTRNALVRNGVEIHLGRHRQTGAPIHVAIERFLTSHNQPSEITQLFGRVMTPAECLQIETDLATFLKAASQVAPVAVDINDGDLVWDGDHAVVVAIS
ncbi:hypothetical protein [Ensifer sp. SSB1]|uniref:hypothetical protein n=1 Tax=Ensifer sp. SSB1 TaxID=2795385 RepID=UPI001A369ABB|nr:hypothetical protein [Ensifer sp. SSB1]MBK5571159.1 hypothetical protein [Ensifer sp. SSB1]